MKNEVAPPIRADSLDPFTTTGNSLIGAVDVTGDLNKVSEDVGHVGQETPTDVDDFQVDVLILAVQI
jgi:hypothetical protein